MADLNLGLSKEIIRFAKQQGLLRNELACVLATAYWETGRTMRPVVEAYWLSETWRKNNLRYYPWHGRGLVQLTWEQNYHKMGMRLGVDFLTNPDDVLLPENTVQILVIGMAEGLFTGKKLSDYFSLDKSDYVGSRRIVNGTDKAQAIAELCREYETALVAVNYGVEKAAPIVNERRDGTQPRTSMVQSSTGNMTITAAIATAANLSDQAKGIVGSFTESFGVSPQFALASVALGCLAYVFRERIKKWTQGDR